MHTQWDRGMWHTCGWAVDHSTSITNDYVHCHKTALVSLTPLAYLQQGLPLTVPALMELSASYEVASKTAVFSASTGNQMWLLSLIKDPVKATFGVDLPVENVGGPTATTAVSMSVGQTGLQQLSVGLGGSYTAASISRTLGITWPVEDDMFVMRAPSVVYTVLPTNLAVTMEVDVPALGVQKMASSLVVQSAGMVQLQVG